MTINSLIFYKQFYILTYTFKLLTKIVVITGIDSTGKTTAVSKLPYPSLKYPKDQEIKDQINSLYNVLTQGGKELNSTVIQNIYRQIHDLYDRDLKNPLQIPDPSEPVLVLDRYYVDNIVYSRINRVERSEYMDNHIFRPDLIIMLKVRNYMEWKKKFVLKGDENVREPAILFEEVQKQYQVVLRELFEKKRIGRYTVIEGLKPDTQQKIEDSIKELITVSVSSTS